MEAQGSPQRRTFYQGLKQVDQEGKEGQGHRGGHCEVRGSRCSTAAGPCVPVAQVRGQVGGRAGLCQPSRRRTLSSGDGEPLRACEGMWPGSSHLRKCHWQEGKERPKGGGLKGPAGGSCGVGELVRTEPSRAMSTDGTLILFWRSQGP